MKHTYFTRIENKYVFNVSLIFWHVLIVLVSLAIIASLGGLLYSLVPPQKKKIEAPVYPEKQAYPDAIKVDFSELELNEVKDQIPVESSDRPPIADTSSDSTQDAKGKYEFQSSLNKLKELIPPSKYSWAGNGYWHYPYGERYWDVYKDERYRQWVVNEPGIEDMLGNAYKVSKSSSYTDRKNLLDGYITVLIPIAEAERSDALNRLLNNVANNVSSNRIMCDALVKVVPSISTDAFNRYISLLSAFYIQNPKDGVPFIEYIATTIKKFDGKQQNAILERIISAYYRNFNQNLTYLKESTDSFTGLLPQISVDIQSKALHQYYIVYLEKNANREKEIARIESEHEQNVNKVDLDYTEAVAAAEGDYLSNSLKKQALKIKSLSGIGGGIMAIVLIATILVFLSIQRSVRKIEEKITIDSTSESNPSKG